MSKRTRKTNPKYANAALVERPTLRNQEPRGTLSLHTRESVMRRDQLGVYKVL